MIRFGFSGLICLLTLTVPLIGKSMVLEIPTIGIFKAIDLTLEGLKWGNWGSNPFEYKWVSQVVDIKDKKVIDLGVGVPSQFNWYEYVVQQLQPSFYAGIDCDKRMVDEQIIESNFEIKHMNMTDLAYEDQFFDVAYCINTFEHIPYNTLINSIQEIHRVLKDGGVLVVTLDERWDKNLPYNSDNNWNILEQSLLESGNFDDKKNAFGLMDFLNLIADYFIPCSEDLLTFPGRGIYSRKHRFPYYKKINRNSQILNSGNAYNSCVSFVVLKKQVSEDEGSF